MNIKQAIVTAVAILVIGALTGCALYTGHDGEILYFSVTAIAGLAGYQIQRMKAGNPP